MWDRIIGLFLLVAMSFAVCCTGEGNYSLDVNFPDDESLASTSVLVVWVLDETPKLSQVKLMAWSYCLECQTEI